METILEKFKLDHPELTIEARDYSYSFTNEVISGTRYILNGFTGNSNIQFGFEKEEEAEELYNILKENIYFFPDFLAVKHNDVIEVLLTTVSYRNSIRIIEEEGETFNKFLEINLPYHRNNLRIEVEIGQNPTSILPQILKYVIGRRTTSRRKPTILKIYNYKRPTRDEMVNDIRNILNSVLFDIEFTYDLILETVNVERLVRRYVRRRKKNSLPEEPINLIFKKYIPELIQYFHTAEKVDYLPFKYITYYHILEYFSDKSAYKLVANEIEKILLKPDFHIKTNFYINQAVNIFKKENEKYTSDKIKIERVLRQFVSREELKDELDEIGELEHFEKEVVLDCVKPLKLPAIDFNKESNFFNHLRNRIYSLRNSIVHSNPDFDETKAIPFIPSPKNINILRIEIEMIAIIAKNIILLSKEG